MKNLSSWKKVVAFITVVFLSALGVKASATAVTEASQPDQTLSSNEDLLAQNCPYNQQKFAYARIRTQGGALNIRSGPNGRVIGAVPNGWTVTTGRKDRTGRWTYLDYGTYYRYPSYVSAPTLRSGWVSSSFLRPLGRFCEKPVAMMRIDLNASNTKKILVHENWVQRGDRIAKAFT